MSSDASCMLACTVIFNFKAISWDPLHTLPRSLAMSLSKTSSAPLSAEEQGVLYALMRRAGISVGSVDPAPCASEMGESDWSVMSGAAMSDACKRRLEESPERQVQRSPYIAPEAPLPFPDALPTHDSGVTSFGKTKRGNLVRLPNGVPSLEKWGRSVLEFGKFASRDWTYEEIMSKSDKEVISYVKWCRSQVDSAEGCLKDFALYIHAVEYDPEQRPLIPGTEVVRRFR
eukprot:s443_g3.t1